MVLSRNAEVFIIFQFLFEFYNVFEKIKILGPWGAQGHGPFGPMGPGDRLDLKDPGLKDPGPMGPGAHGPEIIILMSRMIICRDDKKKLINPRKLIILASRRTL